jgi:eukaryotic-like serine/threonine-protein kinase
MSGERWPRVKALFEAALEQPASERDAFLSTAAGEDDSLRREVESLLMADARDGLLDRLPIPSDDPVVGPDVGPFTVIELIGSGAMGQVFRARDPKLNREVALKVLPALFALDPDRVARFRREAQVLASLNHPNIAAIYGLVEADNTKALVLELIDGPTLAERVALGPMAILDVLAIGRQIAEALEAAHDKGLIHRDLKPANIKLTAGGLVKVLDFGLAKAWEGASHDQLSAAPTLTATHDREGVLLGTPAYMSPEQARGRTLDKRTDIWSFGCVLFEMLSGRAAFAEETVSDTLAHVLDRDVDWDALPSTTPSRLRDLVHRCLQKDATHRLRDIGDARIELQELSTSSPLRAAEVRTGPPLVRRPAHRYLPAVASVAVVAVAIMATAFVVGRNRTASTPQFRQLTFRHGTIGGARLAPDGHTVVYRGTWSGAQPQLYVIRPESMQSGAIGLVNAGIYSVSTHGELAVALGCRLNWGECLGTLAQVPITGGSPRELVKNVLDADWSPDGRNIAVVSFVGSTYRLQYPIDKVLYEPQGWITAARVSPNADRIAFLDHERLGDTSGSVSIVDLKGQKTTLSAGWRALQGLAWAERGDEIWFGGSRTSTSGSFALHAVTLSGQERTVFSSPGMLKLNDISRDGQQVLLTRGTIRGGIIGLEPGAGKERDLSWFDHSTVADLSSDGRTLVFYEWGEGVGARPTVFIRKTDGGDAVRLGDGRPLALSPDGRWVLAIQNGMKNSPPQLVLLPTGTGAPRWLARGQIVEYLEWAAWLPDGRRVVFGGRESKDVRRTYVQDVDGGDPRPVTPDGFVGLVLSPDGKMVAAVDRYGEYYLCSIVEATAPRQLPGYLDGDVILQWGADGRMLFVREAGNATLRIHKLNVSTGDRQFWKELVPPDPAVLIDIGSDPGQIRLTPDGSALAYTYWTLPGELYVARGLR